MFDSIAKTLGVTLPGQEWQTSDDSRFTDGSPERNAISADQNPYFNVGQPLAQSLGYDGNPITWNQSDQAGGGQVTDPAFLQFLASKGITLKNKVTYDGQASTSHLQAFDSQGNPVGMDQLTRLDPDNQFGAAILAATAGVGATILGAGAGVGAGGTAATGSTGAGISADSLAYGSLENGAAYGSGFGDSLVASSEGGLGGLGGEAAGAAAGTGGMSSADLTALYGPGGYGAGGEAVAGAVGSGAAADAASMGLAEGAYPAGVTGSSGGIVNSLGSAASDLGSWANSNKALTSLGGGLLNTGISYLSNQNALKQQQDATNQANALWAPYRDLGTSAVGSYGNLLKNPSSVLSDPGVAFQQQQGQQAIDRRAAAGGGIYSGAQMKAASQYNQNFASTALDKALARYGNAAQLGATGTNATASNITNIGNAGAAATLATGNTLQSGINNSLATLNQSSYTVPDWYKNMMTGH